MDSRTYFWIGYTLVAVVLFLTLFSTLNKLVDQTSFKQSYLSKDLSLTEQVLFISPYNANVEYSVGKDYEISFGEPCFVLVNKANTPSNSGDISYCMFDSYITKEYPEGLFFYEVIKLNKVVDSFEVVSHV